MLMHRLLHLCGVLQVRHPGLAKRMLAEKYNLAATWRRGGYMLWFTYAFPSLSDEMNMDIMDAEGFLFSVVYFVLFYFHLI